MAKMSPNSLSLTLYVGALALVMGGVQPTNAETGKFHGTFGDWIAECKVDRMTDTKNCYVQTHDLGSDGDHRFEILSDLKLDELAGGGGMVIGTGPVSRIF
jgi:hypothetical protein